MQAKREQKIKDAEARKGRMREEMAFMEMHEKQLEHIELLAEAEARLNLPSSLQPPKIEEESSIADSCRTS